MTLKRLFGFSACAAALAAGLAVVGQSIGGGILSEQDWGISKLFAQTALPRPAPVAPNTIANAAPAPTSAPTPATAAARTETIVYDSWTVTCRDTVDKSSKKRCSASFQVIEQKQRQVLLTWIIGRTDSGVLMTLMQTPTGVQIQQGVDLKLGEGAVRKLNYVACLPQRCEASINMDEALIKEASSAGNAVATIYSTDGRNINFNMPIKGIDKALAALGR
jgi:invasion protein IalB